ncbi:MAG TPA: hypothetical protein PJ983_02450, partial [Flavobacteriales bacterium]|nr:hypothetical protein [Flavobacteriales bacterium]
MALNKVPQDDPGAHGNVQGMFRSHLWNNQTRIAQADRFFGDPGQFVPENHGQSLHRIRPPEAERDGLHGLFHADHEIPL